MTRALVLGGGGPVGIAWEAGLIAGLAEGGVELAEADFIMGTSAGSFVGSQLAMGRKAVRHGRRHPRRGRAAALGRADRHPAEPSVGRRAAGRAEPGAADADDAGGRRRRRAIRQEVRQEIGAFALAAKTVDEATFIKSFGRQLSGDQAAGWPEATTPARRSTPRPASSWSGTTTARSGSPRRWPPAAACPASIRRSPSTDAATSTAACARAPTPTSPRATSWWCWSALRIGGADAAQAERQKRALLDREIKVLTDDGAKVELITPDAASQAAFGAQPDGRPRPPRRRRPASSRAARWRRS